MLFGVKTILWGEHRRHGSTVTTLRLNIGLKRHRLPGVCSHDCFLCECELLRRVILLFWSTPQSCVFPPLRQNNSVYEKEKDIIPIVSTDSNDRIVVNNISFICPTLRSWLEYCHMFFKMSLLITRCHRWNINEPLKRDAFWCSSVVSWWQYVMRSWSPALQRSWTTRSS